MQYLGRERDLSEENYQKMKLVRTNARLWYFLFVLPLGFALLDVPMKPTKIRHSGVVAVDIYIVGFTSKRHFLPVVLLPHCKYSQTGRLLNSCTSI